MHRIAAITIFAITVSFAAYAEEHFKRTENVVYKVDHGVGLVMDIWEPTGEKNGHAIIDVLSGAWHSGRGQFNDHVRAGVFDVMTSRGFTVFMVRPGSRTKFTAEEMVDNLHYATRWIRAHADEYDINPDNIGMMGASAGGHLTLLTAMTATGGNAGSNNEIEQQSAKVQAAAAFFPPTDFLDWGGQPRSFERLADILFNEGIGGKSPEEVEAKATAISPARREVPADMPPTLLIHGDADPVVPLQQSQVMIAAFEEAGVTHDLVIKEGGEHAWLTIRQEVELMADWFETHLGAKALAD